MPKQYVDQSPAFNLLGGRRPKYAAISTAASGDTTVVAAVSGRLIRVVRLGLIGADAVVVTWKSSVAGAITGPRSIGAHGGYEATFCPAGIMETALGEALVINLSGAISVGGELTYVELS